MGMGPWHPYESVLHSIPARGVFQFNSILTLPGDGSKPHRLRVQSYTTVLPTPTSDASRKPRSSSVLWPTRYRSEVPTTLSSGLIKLLGWPSELRKPVCSLG